MVGVGQETMTSELMARLLGLPLWQLLAQNLFRLTMLDSLPPLMETRIVLSTQKVGLRTTQVSC